MTISRVCIAALLGASVLSLASAQQSTPATSKHEPALDVTSMDRTVDPCADFFKYSCGSWIKNNPIPPDQSSWDTYSKMQDENSARLRDILESAAPPDAKRDAVTQKIGDYYASCMDEQAINAKGAEPLQLGLQQIAEVTSKADLAEVTASMRHDNVLFAFDATQDYRDASQVIAEVDQGGLGLPDRDYYLKEDAKSADLRKSYVAHVQMMFDLLGDPPDSAAAEAQSVMRIETALAKGSMTQLERREPKNLDHEMASGELGVCPSIQPGTADLD
jgi:putative endopeptidase